MASASASPTNPATQVFTQALRLPPGQREELAMLLLDSLPENDLPIVVDEELEREIDRRLAEREAGNARVVDLASFAATVRAAAKASPSP